MSQAKHPNTQQSSFLYPDLLDQLNPKSPLLQLAQQINWDYFETEFASLYSHLGKPSKPIRLMVGLSILKHLENLSDDVLVERWSETPTTKHLPAPLNFNGHYPAIHQT